MRKNALIVDDSRLACKVMANMLDTFGIVSDAVYSAEQALEYLQLTQPSIIFLDHTMPGMDGLETIKVIKSNPLTATVPIMMYTAKEGDVYVGEARALGAVDVLPKGLEKDYLFKALQKLGMVNSDDYVPVSQMENFEIKQNDPIKQSSDEQDTENKDDRNKDIDITIDQNLNLDDKIINEIKEEITEEIITPEVPDRPANSYEKNQWQSFWEIHLQPFLNRQRMQQTEELQHYTQYQTRKLTKEFHQTLENFEHVLASRIENRQESDSKNFQQTTQKQNNKISVWMVILIIMQLLMVWQLWKVNYSNNQLSIVNQENREWQQQMLEQFALLDEKLLSIEDSTLYSQSQSETNNISQVRVSLVDHAGDPIADLFPVDANRGQYRGVTSTGYQFTVNSQGDVGSPINDRYFMTDDCSGESFIQSASATIFRDRNGELWYVDKQAAELEMVVGSKQVISSECVPVYDQISNLRSLQKDVPYETGLDSSKGMTIYLSH